MSEGIGVNCCGSVLCLGCRTAKTLLLIASDLERIYPNNQQMQRRAAQLRGVAIEWLSETVEAAVGVVITELKKRAQG